MEKERNYIQREREKKSDRGNEYLCSETKVTFHILSAFCVWETHCGCGSPTLIFQIW